MAKPAKPSSPSSKGRDRRAVVEAMRREQQNKERRRTVLVIAACVVVALAIIAFPAYRLIQQNRLAGEPLTALGSSADAAGCSKVTTKKATGNQQHVPQGTPVPYAEAPPAFGAHYDTPAPLSRKFYTDDDGPTAQTLVHNLEHGYTILWYDATVAGNEDQLSAVRAIAAKFEGSQLSSKFIAAPWTEDDGKAFPDGAHVALTHWSTQNDPDDVSKQQGVWQYCDSPSGAAVDTFVKDYPSSDSPEPNAG